MLEAWLSEGEEICIEKRGQPVAWLTGVGRNVLMVTSGAGKAGIVGQVFATDRDARLLPAQLVRRSGATWILDRDAAANLPAGLATE